MLPFVLAPEAMTLVVAGLLAGQPVAPHVPISIAIAEVDGAPVQTPAWVAEQISETQRLYNEIGVYFRVARIEKLGGPPAMETRADRDRLASQLRRGFLNVFVVASLRDVHDDRLLRMGVHWAPNGDLKRQYLIVAASARRTTLAHEIGHYFGLAHTAITDNLMSYSRTGAEVFLDSSQKRKVVTNVRVAVARRELSGLVEGNAH